MTMVLAHKILSLSPFFEHYSIHLYPPNPRANERRRQIGSDHPLLTLILTVLQRLGYPLPLYHQRLDLKPAREYERNCIPLPGMFTSVIDKQTPVNDENIVDAQGGRWRYIADTQIQVRST